MLYPDNIGSQEQLRALTTYLRDAKSWPIPFIAVDQEGELVQRLTGHGYFPSARSVGANPSFATPQAAERLYQTMAEELAKAGFNLNFGPVVDLSINPHNYVIVQRDRSFGADPNTVATLAGAFIRAHRARASRRWRSTFPGMDRAPPTATRCSPTSPPLGRRSRSRPTGRSPRKGCSMG